MIESKIYITRLKPSDVTDEYVEWLNNPEINQYLESKYVQHDLKSTKLFVKKMESDDTNFLFGIFCHATSKHIGNIKLGPINLLYKRAEVGLLIGNSSYWGKGVATEAISLIIDFAKEQLNLHKLEAGCYINNIGSLKAFMKAGFDIEGTLKDHVTMDDNWLDCYRLGKVLDNSKEEK